MAEFFWELIVSRDTKNLELVDNCIQKYRDMVRYWGLDKKQGMLLNLLKCISDPKTPSIPCLKLLQGLIKDQSERTMSYSSNSAGTYPSSGYPASGISQASAAIGYGGTATGGSALRTKAADATQPQNDQKDIATEAQGSAEADEEEPQQLKELTLQGILTSLLTEHELMEHLLEDLTRYYETVHQHLRELNQNQEGTGVLLDREKIFAKGGQYSHQAEIDERLQFVQFVAQ